MLAKDSVFSTFSSPFEDEKPITSEREIASELDKIEKPAISLFEKTFNTAIENAVSSLSKAIKDKDRNAVQKYKWGLSIGLSQNFYAEWLLGFKTGSDRGKKEVKSQKLKVKSKDNLSKDNLAQFNQPEPQSDILRNRPAEEAIKTRTNTLASDVSNSEWEEIKQIILDSIKPQSPTENPISRKELLKRINEKLGDRKNRFKNRAETIARTELTFAYNAGRLDSYVRSGLVSGVKYQTIFDERRCQICASRQGIIVALDDIEGLAQLAIPAHPRCRCVWSPVLKTEFDIEGKKKNRQIKNRKLVPGRSWLAGGIIAALLIPEELFFAGALLSGIKALVTKFGSTSAARLAIANQINKIVSGKSSPVAKAPYAKKLISNSQRIKPLVIAPGIDLSNTNAEQLRSLIPTISDRQIDLILRQERGMSKIKSFQDLSKILDKNQFGQVKAIARQNNIFNLLHPSNNINPAAIWVNSGGIISKRQNKAVFDLIQQQQFNSLDEFLAALKSKGVNTAKLNQYAINLFNRENQI